jgi:hypothetical protein
MRKQFAGPGWRLDGWQQRQRRLWWQRGRGQLDSNCTIEQHLLWQGPDCDHSRHDRQRILSDLHR